VCSEGYKRGQVERAVQNDAVQVVHAAAERHEMCPPLVVRLPAGDRLPLLAQFDGWSEIQAR